MLKVSVIVTNYNYSSFIGRCLRSLLSQSMPTEEYEVIVVDDGSTDNSREIIESFGDKINAIYVENGGVAKASNIGIQAAKGPFVMRVDADDYVNPHMLLIMSEALFWNPDFGFVYCDHFRVDEREERVERIRLNTVDKLYNHGAGILFRKANLESLGLYDVDIDNCEDFDLLIRYLKNWDGYHVKMPLYRYTQHGNSLTDNIEQRTEREKTVREKHNLYPDYTHEASRILDGKKIDGQE
ncbi:MAG: glycosyltransferase family A protein [Candidatus Thalassarchaeaceae archaeon]|nr:glycosyltransferase family A protein [Candidatus Thalassarchaeaceae archaeon]